MFTDRDINRIQKVIDCARLELQMWDFLNPSQRQCLQRKIEQMQAQLEYAQTRLEAS